MILRVLLPGRLFPRLSSAVTLLQSEGRNVLVDSGAPHSAGSLLQAMGRAGLAPADIDTIVSTHLHYDHCGNHLLFSRARYLVGMREFTDTSALIDFYHSDQSTGKRDTAELLRSQNQTIKEFYVRSIVREITGNLDFYDALVSGDRRFVPLAGGAWLTDGIEVFPSPGHTFGHLSVLAHRTRFDGAASSVDVLVAGDALPTHGMLAEGAESDVELAADTALFRTTRKHLLDHFRFIVPGHGALTDTDSARASELRDPFPAVLSKAADVEAR